MRVAGPDSEREWTRDPYGEHEYTHMETLSMEVSRRKTIQMKQALSPSQATVEHMNEGLYKGPNRHRRGRGVDNCPVSYTHLPLPTIYSVKI